MEQANLTFIITFAMISMGFLIKHFGFITEAEGKVISKFLMHTTFPALMIVSTATVDIKPQLFLIPFLCIGLGSVMMFIARKVFKREPDKLKGVLFMGAGGMNVGLFGFPLIEGIWGVKALLYAVMFDLGNTFMTFGVVYPTGAYYAHKEDGAKISKKKILKKVFLLPPVTGAVIGLLINFFSIPVPDIGMEFLQILAKANKPLVLLIMGIYLSVELDKSQIARIAKLLTIRYVVGLMVVAALYYFLPDSLMRSVLIILVILPLGMTILIFSDEFKYDSRIAGTAVNLSLVVSFVLMWALVWLLKLA